MFENVIRWSLENFDHLPWRQNRTLYRTLVSEIMLQQTTVGTVLNHFEKFLIRFPDLKSLTTASEEELLLAWKGLGYYRRAKNLKKIAEQIDARFGDFPKTQVELLSLNGVGPYTANALLAIGLDQKALALDANLERVIARFYGLEEWKGPRLLRLIEEKFLDQEIFYEEKISSYRALNEALMDLGRVYCKATKVECTHCPLNHGCKANQSQTPLLYPRQKMGKKLKMHELVLIRILVKSDQKILAYQKSNEQWLSGQWEIPTFIFGTTDPTLSQYPVWPQTFFMTKEELEKMAMAKVKTSITKYSIQNYLIELSWKEFKLLASQSKYEWLHLRDRKLLSTASLKMLKNREEV